MTIVKKVTLNMQLSGKVWKSSRKSNQYCDYGLLFENL